MSELKGIAKQRRARLMLVATDNVLEYLDLAVDEWHSQEEQSMPLSEYLGLTEAEYAVFVTNASDLPALLKKGKLA